MCPTRVSCARLTRRSSHLVEAGFQTVGEHLEAVQLARRTVVKPCDWPRRSTNTSIQPHPGLRSRPIRLAAAKTIYTALRVIDSLKAVVCPLCPLQQRALAHLPGLHPADFWRAVHGRADVTGWVLTIRCATVLHKPGGRWEPSNLQPGQRLVAACPTVQEAGASVGRRGTEAFGEID